VRVVIDTNVLISANFWTGKPKQLLNRVRHQEITFVTSNDLLNELKEILIRRDKPFHLSDNEAEDALSLQRIR
jgi:putative PIN family toxin of toxin-antitoxin system